jgi:hypothetical protein
MSLRRRDQPALNKYTFRKDLRVLLPYLIAKNQRRCGAREKGSHGEERYKWYQSQQSQLGIPLLQCSYSNSIVMVTKSDLDKAMVDLKSQFDTQLAALRDHADLSVQQDDERIERRLATAEEQNRLKEAQLQTNIVHAVVGCIREEMNARFATLESKVDRMSGSSSGKGILPTPDQHLSIFCTTVVHETGNASIESCDFLRTESKFQFPRSDCPGFGGDNPIEWLRKCRSFFELHQVPIPYRTHLATLQFHADASDWYDSYLLDHEPPGWDELVSLVTTRFKRANY